MIADGPLKTFDAFENLLSVVDPFLMCFLDFSIVDYLSNFIVLSDLSCSIGLFFYIKLKLNYGNTYELSAVSGSW